MPHSLNKHRDDVSGAIYIGRPSKWGNPMTVREVTRLFPGLSNEEAHQAAVDWYAKYLDMNPTLLAALPELEGRDLYCWCKPLPCHGDILLERLEKK